MIQRTSIPTYQRLFTLLLQVYRAKQCLQRVTWTGMSRTGGKPNRKHLSYTLRHHLIWFVDELRSYLTDTVFAPATTGLRAQMLRAEGIGEMEDVHARFVDGLVERCLIGPATKPILDAVLSILDLAVGFFDIHQSSGSLSKPSHRSENEPQRSGARRQRKSLTNRRRSARFMLEAVVDFSSDSESHSDSNKSAAQPGLHRRDVELPIFEHSLDSIREGLDRLLPFIVAGLKSLGRAGGEDELSGLAERLALWRRCRQRSGCA